jgi:hypothetical protein
VTVTSLPRRLARSRRALLTAFSSRTKKTRDTRAAVHHRVARGHAPRASARMTAPRSLLVLYGSETGNAQVRRWDTPRGSDVEDETPPSNVAPRCRVEICPPLLLAFDGEPNVTIFVNAHARL